MIYYIATTSFLQYVPLSVVDDDQPIESSKMYVVAAGKLPVDLMSS